MQDVGILGLGHYLPGQVLTNADMEKLVDTSDEWIRSRTGIVTRYRADITEATSDLSLQAANRALQDAGITADELDLIIVATVTPDMAFPSTACLLQDALGAKRAAAFDVSAACTGFIYALTLAQSLISQGLYRYCLVVGAETLSRITDYTDRNTCVLFGDGAGAAVLGPSSTRRLMGFELGADGAGASLLSQPAGGSRLPASSQTLEEKQHYIHMEGQEVFKFAISKMPDVTLSLLKKAGLSIEQLDWLVPHQANRRIIESATKRLGHPIEKTVINLQNYGNMSSASIPVALSEAAAAGVFKSGDKVVLVGFGGGLTWGATLIEW